MLIKYTVTTAKSLVLVKPTITKYGSLKSFLAFRNLNGNRPLKGPALGSADKNTTLLPLVGPIKPEFHWRIFSCEATFC